MLIADKPADPDLQQAVVEELARKRSWRLSFAPVIEEQLEADEGAERRQRVVRSGIFGLCIYDLFLLNDFVVRPDIFFEALAWRTLATSFAALVLLGIWRQWFGPVWRERLLGVALVLVLFCSCEVFENTGSDVRTYDAFVFSLAFLAGNVSLPLRFGHALWASLAMLSTTAVYIVPDERMPLQAKIFAMALMAASALFTVQACLNIERAARQSYLLRLRESLASRAAERRAAGYARLSETDALTGLPNRRAFDAALGTRWRSPAATWCALVLIDIDNFKAYNDCYGHPAGDECLRRVSAAMRSSLPAEAFLARLGGEEFVAIIEERSAAACQRAAERLRQAVEALAIPNPHSEAGVVTISLGLALKGPHTGGAVEALVVAADAALYSAKHQGRNRWAQASNHGDLLPREPTAGG